MTTESDVKPPVLHPLGAVLPSHAHVEQGCFEWSARWTTPDGLWIVRGGAFRAYVAVGPHELRLMTRDVDLVISTLQLAGAFGTSPDVLAADADAIREAAKVQRDSYCTYCGAENENGLILHANACANKPAVAGEAKS